MEYDKINLLDSESEQLSKFVTREYVTVNSLLNTYNENKSIRFKTPMLRSNLCDYSDAYILVKGTIKVAGDHPRDGQNRYFTLKNNALFASCITRINGELIKDADDLDIVMPMYNLLEYSKSYRKTIGSLYNYYRDELDDSANLNNFANNKYKKIKNKLLENTYNVDSTRVNAAGNARERNPNYNEDDTGTSNVISAIPLKYLGNFWRALNTPLISCEVYLELKWDKNA